jgi:hypothetical protein
MQKIVLSTCLIGLLVAYKKETTSTIQLNEIAYTKASIPFMSNKNGKKMFADNAKYEAQLALM